YHLDQGRQVHGVHRQTKTPARHGRHCPAGPRRQLRRPRRPHPTGRPLPQHSRQGFDEEVSGCGTPPDQPGAAAPGWYFPLRGRRATIPNEMTPPPCPGGHDVAESQAVMSRSEELLNVEEAQAVVLRHARPLSTRTRMTPLSGWLLGQQLAEDVVS